MPATQAQPSGEPWRRPTSNSIHAAIIVGVLIGVLGIVAILLFLWDRKRNHGVKKGFQTKSRFTTPRSRSPSWLDKDSTLETGVVHEPLPVYQKEANADEKWV
jgi:hypothetical protein